MQHRHVAGSPAFFEVGRGSLSLDWPLSIPPGGGSARRSSRACRACWAGACAASSVSSCWSLLIEHRLAGAQLLLGGVLGHQLGVRHGGCSCCGASARGASSAGVCLACACPCGARCSHCPSPSESPGSQPALCAAVCMEALLVAGLHAASPGELPRSLQGRAVAGPHRHPGRGHSPPWPTMHCSDPLCAAKSPQVSGSLHTLQDQG